jgi:thiamine biosynthesis lipoprotein
MGTLVTISVVHPSATAARGMVVAAFAEMERLEAILSRHREGTPVSRLNAEGVVRGAPAELTAVVRKALHYSALSDGAFDITVAPLLELYASSFALTGAPPSDSRVEDIRSLVGHRDILVDDGSIAFKKPGMSITLDGIAKGHIVDRAVSMLRESGAKHVLVDAGGDMASVGEAPSGDGWRIAIQDPRAEDGYLGILQLRDNSVATSGDYLEYFAQDKRSHHILDPRTGKSPENTSAVTVLAPTAMEADALSTAILVLGARDGFRLLSELEGVEGLIITKGQDVLRSRGLSRFAA